MLGCLENYDEGHIWNVDFKVKFPIKSFDKAGIKGEIKNNNFLKRPGSVLHKLFIVMYH